MRRIPTVIAALLLPVSLVAQAEAEGVRPGEVHLLMRTEAGDLHLAIDTLHAPITGTNFLYYADAGLYTGGTFYRVVHLDNQPTDSVRIEVIQGGMDPARRELAAPPIPLESTEQTGLRHTDGVLSMARSGPNSARAEFFITIGDQPSLDAGGARNPDGLGFAVFGRVIDGMDLVREIQRRPAEGQYLTTRVGIRFVERVGGR